MRLTRVLVAVVIAISIPAVVSASIQYDLPFSVTEPFSISYDAGTSMVTSILGGVTLTVIDGESVMDQSQATGNGLDNLWIQGAILNDGFTLTGNAVLT